MSFFCLINFVLTQSLDQSLTCTRGCHRLMAAKNYVYAVYPPDSIKSKCWPLPWNNSEAEWTCPCKSKGSLRRARHQTFAIAHCWAGFRVKVSAVCRVGSFWIRIVGRLSSFPGIGLMQLFCLRLAVSHYRCSKGHYMSQEWNSTLVCVYFYSFINKYRCPVSQQVAELSQFYPADWVLRA